MAENPKPPSFFIRDPFTEEVQGPLSLSQLKRWAAQGAVGDWGVSKSASGPWTPANKVKGLVATEHSDTSSAVPQVAPANPSNRVPVATEAVEPADGNSISSASSTGSASGVITFAKKHFPKSIIGRVLVSLVGIWLSLVTVLGISFGIRDAIWGAKERQVFEDAKAAQRRTRAALDQALEQSRGYDAMRNSVIKDAEYERARRETGR